jgi:hypothetical protein
MPKSAPNDQSVGDLHKKILSSINHRTMMINSIFLFSLAIASGHAFVPASSPSEVRAPAMASATAIKAESDDSIVDTIQTSFRIAQESNAAGYGFKQVVADVLAGDFDQDAVSQTIDETVASAPCGTYYNTHCGQTPNTAMYF